MTLYGKKSPKPPNDKTNPSVDTNGRDFSRAYESVRSKVQTAIAAVELMWALGGGVVPLISTTSLVSPAEWTIAESLQPIEFHKSGQDGGDIARAIVHDVLSKEARSPQITLYQPPSPVVEPTISVEAVLLPHRWDTEISVTGYMAKFSKTTVRCGGTQRARDFLLEHLIGKAITVPQFSPVSHTIVYSVKYPTLGGQLFICNLIGRAITTFPSFPPVAQPVATFEPSQFPTAVTPDMTPHVLQPQPVPTPFPLSGTPVPGISNSQDWRSNRWGAEVAITEYMAKFGQTVLLTAKDPKAMGEFFVDNVFGGLLAGVGGYLFGRSRAKRAEGHVKD